MLDAPASLTLPIGGEVFDRGSLVVTRSGGLGKRLAGILDDSLSGMETSQGAGLRQLVGRTSSLTPSRVRKFVADTAIGVLADGFEAEAVVIARQDSRDELPLVSVRLPPSWEERPGMAFQLFGHLWRVLEAAPHSATDDYGEVQRFDSGRQRIWLGCQAAAGGYLAAAVVRPAKFTTKDRWALSRLTRSVAVAAAPKVDRKMARGLTATVANDGAMVVATVEMSTHGHRRRCSVRAARAEVAVATATATMIDPEATIDFAGSVVVDGSTVSLVLVSGSGASSLLGVGISRDGDHVGVAEAVVSALTCV